jgi:hypothetical protein
MIKKIPVPKTDVQYFLVSLYLSESSNDEPIIDLWSLASAIIHFMYIFLCVIWAK